MSNTLTVSNSGTAWIKDMMAQGKDPIGGWQNSPKAAYYASLDKQSPGDLSTPTAAALPTSFADIMKLQADAVSGKKPA